MSALVGIVMGSQSDWEAMSEAAKILDQLDVPYEVRVISAHRTPDRLFEWAGEREAEGMEVIIAGAGGAAHLPGVTAAKTPLPVLGVPMESKSLKGLDSLLSIVQMPSGVPVGTLAIGKAGAANAGLFAASIIALHNKKVERSLAAFRTAQRERYLAMGDPREKIPTSPKESYKRRKPKARKTARKSRSKSR